MTIFVRDEIVPGFNDRCRVIPAGRDKGREARHSAYVAELARLMSVCTAERSRRKPTHDSVAAPVHSSISRLDRAIANLERRIPDAPNAGPTVSQMMQQYNRAYEAQQARICAEAEAAYAARNPHTKENTR